MVGSTFFVTIATAALLALAAGKNCQNPNDSRIPGAYIFEFEDGHDSSEFFAKAASEDGSTRMHFDYQLFKGASIQFSDIENAGDKAGRIASLPGVKQAWPVQIFKGPAPKIEWVGSSNEILEISANQSADNTGPDTFSPHVMTQVDKLRAEGITGTGIKIAIIDTGIDYTHPALGGCFGPGCLVSFGTDLVGDDYDGYNTPHPDHDPMDCFGHGTHVAGIIAAQNNTFGFTGAAPGVKLGIFRVIGCKGDVSNDILIAAFNQAFEAGANIISASIGGPAGWSEDPWSVAVSRIVKKGVPCTLAAGNDGPEGLFYASAAADGNGVQAIASFDNAESPALLNVSHYTVNGRKSHKFGYTTGLPAAWSGVKLPLYAPDFNLNVADGGCNPYPADTLDLSGHVVLVRRGTCTFVQKAQNAANAGAKYIMLYNNVYGTTTFDVSTVEGILAAGMVTPDQGKQWITLLKNGSKVVLDMENAGKEGLEFIQYANNLTGGAVSAFTSWGPSWEMDVKPKYGAPGGNILSTYPTDLGSYAVLSGTSMATPLTAAILALIAEVRGTFDPELLGDLLSANSNPQLFNDGLAFYQFLAPVPQQGGGLIQAYDAAYAKTLLSPSSMSFNDTDNFVSSMNFTIRNTGSKHVTYRVSHVPAVTMYTLVAGTIYTEQFPNEFLTPVATLKFSEHKVTVAAGHAVTIQVVPTPPKGLNATRLPVWSGYVAVNGSDGSSLSLPYQGVTGSLHHSRVLGPRDTWISSSQLPPIIGVPANTTFTLPPPGTVTTNQTLEAPTNHTLPTLAWFLALGTSVLEAEVIRVGCLAEGYYLDAKNVSLGPPVTFPLLWNAKGQGMLEWTGLLANGEYAPAGRYKIVFRALRIFGNAKKEVDWDVSETLVFGIRYRHGN